MTVVYDPDSTKLFKDAVQDFYLRYLEQYSRLLPIHRLLTLLCIIFDELEDKSGRFNLGEQAANDVLSVKKRAMKHILSIHRLLQGTKASFDRHSVTEWDTCIWSLDRKCTTADNRKIDWDLVDLGKVVLEQLLNIMEALKACHTLHNGRPVFSKSCLEDLIHRVSTWRSAEHDITERERLTKELTSYREYYVTGNPDGEMEVFFMRYLSDAPKNENVRETLGRMQPEVRVAIGSTINGLNSDEEGYAFELLNLEDDCQPIVVTIQAAPHPKISVEKLEQLSNVSKGRPPLRMAASLLKTAWQMPSGVHNLTTAMERWPVQLTTSSAIQNDTGTGTCTVIDDTDWEL